jgi:hypothetical protein
MNGNRRKPRKTSRSEGEDGEGRDFKKEMLK